MAHDVNGNDWWRVLHESDEIKPAEFYRNVAYIKIEEEIKKAIAAGKTEVYIGQGHIGEGMWDFLERKGFTIRVSKTSHSIYNYLQL